MVFRLAFILLSILVFCPTPQAAEMKKVVFIRYRIAPTYFATVIQEVKEGMRKRGYVEGRNITYVDVLTSTADRDSVPEVLAAVAEYKDSADMFITCGWVSMYVRDKLRETATP